MTLTMVTSSYPRFPGDSVGTFMKKGLEYIVVARWSAKALPTDSRYVNAGNTVLRVDPSEQRWGPLVRIIRVPR